MKLKAVTLALLLAGFSTSVAVAGDGHGKGQDNKKGGDAKALTASSSTTTTAKTKTEKAKQCRPSVQLEVRGTVAAVSGDSLAVLVTKGGAQGAKLAGKQLTFDTSNAKVRGTLAAGAPVRVHARACVDLVALTVTLSATDVRAGAVKSDDGDDDGTTSSTTTTTTTTTP